MSDVETDEEIALASSEIEREIISDEIKKDNKEEIVTSSANEETLLSSSDSDDASSTEEPMIEEKLVRAESCKESGNEYFKKQENAEAIKFYEKGIKIVGRHCNDDIPLHDVKVKLISLLVSLQLNKAAAFNKLEDWKSSILSCDQSLALIEKNEKIISDVVTWKVKACFRRGTAHSKSGNLESAKSDLVAALKLDRSNKGALKEYNLVKRKLSECKAAEKASFSNMFSKGMYDDKEAARKRAALKAIEADRLLREQWNEQVKDGSTSFDDWCKENEEKRLKAAQLEKEEEEERAKLREEERRRKKAEQADDDDLDLDEEDLKAIAETRKKGYCYFRTERSAKDLELIGSTTPVKIDTSNDALSTTGSSAWNANGTTWEEKDITVLAKEKFHVHLHELKVESEIIPGHNVEMTTSVSDVDGHAQLVVSRKKGGAPVFDLSAKLKWSLKYNEEKATGTIAFPDIHNGVDINSVERTIKVTKSLKSQDIQSASLLALERECCEALSRFVGALEAVE